jgi:hypothetical protein
VLVDRVSLASHHGLVGCERFITEEFLDSIVEAGEDLDCWPTVRREELFLLLVLGDDCNRLLMSTVGELSQTVDPQVRTDLIVSSELANFREKTWPNYNCSSVELLSFRVDFSLYLSISD